MTTETMNTGDVSRRMGIPVTADLLLKLGFEPAGKDKRATLWDQADYPRMCNAMGDHIKGQAKVPMQPKPERSQASPASKPATKTTPRAADDDDEL